MNRPEEGVHEIICILCPNGCVIQAEVENGEIIGIEGQKCPKGKQYVKNELLNPTRIITSTARVRGGELPLVSVKTRKEIPREKISELMDQLAEVELEVPVEIGDKVMEFNSTDIVATKKIKKE